MDLLSGLAKLLPKGACAGHQTSFSANNATWNSNTTTWGTNTTENPAEGKDTQADNPHSQFSAFVQLWAGLQPILCGNNRCVCVSVAIWSSLLAEPLLRSLNPPFFTRIIEPEALKQGNMSSLGFTSKEQRNLGLLVHLMTTNPKILYSPIGSQVDKVIQKASKSHRSENVCILPFC